MTREDAIRWLEDIHRRFNPTGENLENEGGDVHLQAIDMAIEALQNLSKPNNGLQDSDLISRQDAIDAVLKRREETRGAWYGGMSEAVDVIDALPSAEAVQNRKARDRLYIKVYADDDPQDKAEKLYQICYSNEALSEVAKCIQGYLDEPSAETSQDLAKPNKALKGADMRGETE